MRARLFMSAFGMRVCAYVFGPEVGAGFGLEFISVRGQG